jgi:hypothetical protein
LKLALKQQIIQDINYMFLHKNAIKALVNEYFSEKVAKLDKQGHPVFQSLIGKGGQRKKYPVYIYKTFDTKDIDKLSALAACKLEEYLNPGPIPADVGPILLKSEKIEIGNHKLEILKQNALNKKLRVPKMFYEAEINKAYEYQTYFPDYRKDSDDLKYWSKLEVWINYLQARIKQRSTSKNRNESNGIITTI